MMHSWPGRLLAILMVATQSGPALANPTGISPETLWQNIESSRLELDRAVEVRGLSLNTGMALFKIEQGIFFPTTPIGERTVEMVFQGSARLILEPPDEIEAGQLDLFTGNRTLNERVQEAVLVINLDAAADAIFSRPKVAELDVGTRQRAQELYEQWRKRPERGLLGVETAIFRDALGDPLIEGYFAGWLRGEELEELLYVVDPTATEQVTLGRFTVLDATEKQKRKLARRMHRQQRKGRLIGVSVADLGLWDTWLSTSHQTQNGTPRPGIMAFEPRHYELDLVLAEPRFELRGRARLHLRPLSSLTRVVKLAIHSDLQAKRVSDQTGSDLFFHQIGGEILVVLPEPPTQEEELVLEIEYSGHLIDKVGSKTYALRTTTHWYPHAGSADLATYDVTFHWPTKIDLVAAGRLIDSGKDAEGRRFERRRLEQPTLAFGFEVGKFRTLTGRAGDVEVTLACDAEGSQFLDKESREQLLATVLDALEYFEQTFGPYPLDEMVVVTVPRAFSQSLLGFLTLSSLSMLEESWLTWILGFEDRRTVIAHEVAHQWWGHVVPWQSYRDQWISEAMANYAAMLYARRRLAAPPGVGPISGWQQAMTATVRNGRPIESIGPLVLGERLSSSISADAYQSIVYKKGAVVLDMLARSFGEKTFLEILRNMVQAVAFRRISTEVFVDAIERISQRDLEAFAQQFIYGTGLPEVYYSYDFERGASGNWQARVMARQESPYRYHYQVVDLENGTLDVLRQRLDQTEIGNSTLYVPVQIAVFNPAGRQSNTDQKSGLDPRVAGNALLVTHVALQGEANDFTVSLEYEPKELWLDRQGEVFGRFFNERRLPKRMTYYQGLDQAGARHHAEAEALFHRALTAEVFSGPAYDYAPNKKELEDEGHQLDTWIRSQLVRLYLDQGRTADARATFDKLRQRLNKSLRQMIAFELSHLEARLAIHEGDPERAYKLLRKPLLARGDHNDTEGLLLLAIAAQMTEKVEDYQTALKAAIGHGADVAALSERSLKSQ